jgi:hypothetical protein
VSNDTVLDTSKTVLDTNSNTILDTSHTEYIGALTWEYDEDDGHLYFNDWVNELVCSTYDLVRLPPTPTSITEALSGPDKDD